MNVCVGAEQIAYISTSPDVVASLRAISWSIGAPASSTLMSRSIMYDWLVLSVSSALALGTISLNASMGIP
jgi:hypothetical protein